MQAYFLQFGQARTERGRTAANVQPTELGCNLGVVARKPVLLLMLRHTLAAESAFLRYSQASWSSRRLTRLKSCARLCVKVRAPVRAPKRPLHGRHVLLVEVMFFMRDRIASESAKGCHSRAI